MGIVSDIKTRTFGIEIEMCNLDRNKVVLPPGYSWSKDEEIVNTDGTCNKKFGGEVNTPPLRLCMEDLHGLKSVYESMVAAGGVIKWTTYTHVHIYAGDLTVEQMKRVFLFFYVCYPFVKKYTKLSDWDELTFNCQPLPTEKYFNGVLSAQSFDDLKTLFTNQSKKGYIRHAFNLSAYFKTKTIEFRTYHGTDDFYMVMNCVFATYRMFYYAVNHTLDDFRSIASYDEFKEAAKLKHETPKELVPLIYQGNPYSPIETFYAKPISGTSKLYSALLKSVEEMGLSEISVVNSFLFQYELSLWKRIKVKCYNQDGYNHLLYKLAKGITKIHYNGKLEWLEKHNADTPVRQLAIALYVFKLSKYMGNDSDFNKSMIEVCAQKAEESIAKIEKSAKRLIEMLSSIEYVNGNLHDAISASKNIFFNFGRNKKARKALKKIMDNSDYENDVVEKPVDYYELIENLPKDTYFFMFSDSPYLSNMHKVAYFRNAGETRDSAGRFLYCNKDKQSNVAATNFSEASSIEINLPPDDLDISDPSKLRLAALTGKQLNQLRRMFIKKIDTKHIKCPFCYAIMYDNYLLGAFGIEFSRDEYDLSLLCDFCTNNNVPRLSKLIIMCILSAEMKKILSRKNRREVNTLTTTVFTKKPVSSKYRGIFKINRDKSSFGKLVYIGTFGKYVSLKEIVGLYKKYVSNAGK